MLGGFGCGLRGVVTLNTHDLGAFNAAILGDVIEVTEFDCSQLRLSSQR
jgi:hypothetical protein